MTALVRRVALACLLIVVTVVLWAASPLLLVGSAVASPLVSGRLRPLRLTVLVLLHLLAETVLLVEMAGLWIVSGFGIAIRRPYFERIHYDLVQTYLDGFFAVARWVLNLTIATEGPDPDATPGDPLLVCCRHAGVGDSFTLVYALMHWYGREPRVVLKDSLAWDPAIGMVLHRLPSRFLCARPGPGEDMETQVGELARNLDHNDAFVIFPEGGNFTPRRRQRAIDRLRRLGLEKMARRAERMRHVVAPRPGGLLAALDAAPAADVVLVAHTGLDHLVTAADLWREMPMDKRLVMRWWRVTREEIPTDRDGRIDWLYSWWERIDGWISEQAGDMAGGSATRAAAPDHPRSQARAPASPSHDAAARTAEPPPESPSADPPA